MPVGNTFKRIFYANLAGDAHFMDGLFLFVPDE